MLEILLTGAFNVKADKLTGHHHQNNKILMINPIL